MWQTFCTFARFGATKLWNLKLCTSIWNKMKTFTLSKRTFSPTFLSWMVGTQLPINETLFLQRSVLRRPGYNDEVNFIFRDLAGNTHSFGLYPGQTNLFVCHTYHLLFEYSDVLLCVPTLIVNAYFWKCPLCTLQDTWWSQCWARNWIIITDKATGSDDQPSSVIGQC